MKKRSTKLKLDRETLRQLTGNDLRQIAGGTMNTHYCTRFTDCCTGSCTANC